MWLLMIKDGLRGSPGPEPRDPGEAGLPEDLHDIRVSPDLVPLLLPGRQMAADEAETRLMQRHAD